MTILRLLTGTFTMAGAVAWSCAIVALGMGAYFKRIMKTFGPASVFPQEKDARPYQALRSMSAILWGIGGVGFGVFALGLIVQNRAGLELGIRYDVGFPVAIGVTLGGWLFSRMYVPHSFHRSLEPPDVRQARRRRVCRQLLIAPTLCIVGAVGSVIGHDRYLSVVFTTLAAIHILLSLSSYRLARKRMDEVIQAH